jgi:hypothetical protein
MREEWDDDSLVPPWEKEKANEPEQQEKQEPAEPEPDDTDDHTQTIEVNDVTITVSTTKTNEPKSEETKMQGYRLGDILEGNLHYAFTCLVDKWFVQGVMDRDERMTLTSAIGDALDLLHNRITDDLYERDVSYGPIYSEPMGYYSQDPDFEGKGEAFSDTEPQQTLGLLHKMLALAILEGKAGRVLSAANAAKIQQALAHLNEVLITAGLIEIEQAAMHEDEEDDESKQQQKGNEAGPGEEDPPTSDGAGPNGSSPTSDEHLLQMINVERSENDLLEI